MDRRADVNPTVYYDSNIFRLIPDSSDPFPTSGLCMCVYWGPYMSIDLWPHDSHTSWLPRYAKLYFFWIILVIQSIWAHFRWNRTNLKIWPPVKKVNDFLLIWPLSQERNIVWISCNWIFCSLWPKEEFDIHYNLIEARWLFWYHVALPPSCDPPAPDWFMCPP